MDDQTRIELEAAAFRRLQQHLMEERTDVQNIDMMNLAGFCRNCLSRWYQEAANERGIDMGKDEAREIFYGMTMAQWKAEYQTEANAEQKAAFETAFQRSIQASPRMTEVCELKVHDANDDILVDVDWRSGGLAFDMTAFLESSLGRLTGPTHTQEGQDV